MALSKNESSYVGQAVRRIRRRYTVINGGNRVCQASGHRDSSIQAN